MSPLTLSLLPSDLSAGRAIDRPTSSYTVVSWSLMKIQLARFVQAAFQSPDPKRTEEDQYAVVLEVDTVFETFLNELPEWWTDGRLPVRDMPSTYKVRVLFTSGFKSCLALNNPTHQHLDEVASERVRDSFAAQASRAAPPFHEQTRCAPHFPNQMHVY